MKRKIYFSLLFVAALFHEEEAYAKKRVNTLKYSPKLQNSTAYTANAQTRLGIGLASIIGQGDRIDVTGVQFNLEFKAFEQMPLYVGMDAGLYCGGFFCGAVYGAFTAQVMPTILYRMTVAQRYHPYVGAAAGISYQSQDEFFFLEDVRENYLNLALFARAGMDFGFTDRFALNGELKLGLIGTSLSAMPQISAVFSL